MWNIKKIALALSIALLTLGCAQREAALPDAEEVESRLTQPQGGYELTQEEPAFGLPTIFQKTGLLTAQPEAADPLVDAPEIVTYSQPNVGNRRFVLVAAWGQPRLSLAQTQVINWSGEIRVSQGAVVARRTLRFEPPFDRLLPRNDIKVLPFSSYTQPHHDGLLVNIYVPAAQDPATPAQVEVELAALASPIVIPVTQLDGYRLVMPVDDLGNYVFISAVEIPETVCGGGFLLGHWHAFRPGLGIFIGQWANATGLLHGHLAGIWGVKPNGERVFLGKYIGVAGQARGLLAGTYGEGHFDGVWLGQNGPRGLLKGAYRDFVAGEGFNGIFIGGWVQTSCEDAEQPAE